MATSPRKSKFGANYWSRFTSVRDSSMPYSDVSLATFQESILRVILEKPTREARDLESDRAR